MPTQEEIAEALGRMTVLELIALTRYLEDMWGIRVELSEGFLSPCPMIFPGPGACPGCGRVVVGPHACPGGAPVDYATEFSVVLVDVGPRKIEVMKALRGAASFGLKEVKDLVEAAAARPQEIRGGLSRVDAEALWAKVQAAGGRARVEPQ